MQSPEEQSLQGSATWRRCVDLCRQHHGAGASIHIICGLFQRRSGNHSLSHSLFITWLSPSCVCVCVCVPAQSVLQQNTPFGRIAQRYFFGSDDEFRNNRFKLIPKVIAAGDVYEDEDGNGSW